MGEMQQVGAAEGTSPHEDGRKSLRVWLGLPARRLRWTLASLALLIVRLRARLVAGMGYGLASLRAARLSFGRRRHHRRLVARGATILALLTLLAGPGSPLVGWAQVAQAHGLGSATPSTPAAGAPWKADANIPNHFNPAPLSMTPHAAVPAVSPTPTVIPAQQSFRPIARGDRVVAQPALLALSATSGAHFVSSDGTLEIDVPTGAVSAADLRAANGKKLALRVIQTAPGSGSNAGGSGHVSLGSYLLQVVDGKGFLAAQGLRQPLRVTLHVSGRDDALDLAQVAATINGGAPAGTTVAIAPSLGGKNTTTTASGETIAGLGTLTTTPATFDRSAQTLSIPLTADSPSTTLTWNTFAPVATFGSPDPFNTDLNAGALTTSIPLDTPAGPDGLAPPLALTYSSESVAEQHSPQGADSWVGQGWNLGLGSITWAEHQGTSGCQIAGPTCSAEWEDSWQLSDPYGTAADLIPPNINVATYYEDSGNPITPSPAQWHTAPETRAKIYSFQSGITLPDGGGVTPPCFRVFLPNGIMEEFGCTSDSLEYYYSTSDSKDYVYAWNLDLITDRQGNQIHVLYQQDQESNGTHPYIRDAYLAYVQWGSPLCQNANTWCSPAGTAPNQWHPHFSMNFGATHTPLRLIGTAPTGCNTGANLRCDDPGDAQLTGPLVMSDYALNDAVLWVRADGAGGWSILKDYQFSYSQSGLGQIPDPITGKTEDVAGYLLLKQVVETGEDQATSLPPLTFNYIYQTAYYEDSQFAPTPATTCGPSWNTGAGLGTSPTHPNPGCALWSQTYAPNSWFLATFDNGMGLDEAYTWQLARNNTHGDSTAYVDPFYCDGLSASAQAAYPCDLADDENWSHIVLSTRTDTTIDAENQQVPGVTQYRYGLSNSYGANNPIWSYECGDCDQTMYWGNVDDWDILDYYNATFMGFATATVTNPDGSSEVHQYDATLGYGVYDSAQLISLNKCTASLQPYTNCWNDAWAEPENALHGHETEVESYDTDGAPLSMTTTQYQATCPATGDPSSPADAGWGNWDGNLVAELDHGNPVMSCDLEPTQTDTYTYNGASASTPLTQLPHVTTGYSYDSLSRLTDTTVNSNGGGSAPGSPTVMDYHSDYIWNDTVSATQTGASGVYLLDDVADSQTRDSGDTLWTSCAYRAYDGQGFANGPSSGLTLGEVTFSDMNLVDGTSANGFACSHNLRTTYAYDASGNLLASSDPDANSGLTEHQGCTPGGGVAVSGSAAPYTTCTTLDSAFYDTQPSVQTNALGQQVATASYDPGAGGGFGLWPTATSDANGQTTQTAYDVLGRVTAVAEPGDSLSAPTTSYTYTDWCQPTGAQAPCTEVDQTQRLDSGHTVTQRAFFDGLGRLVETRTPAPGGKDVVVYHVYDNMGRDVFDSNPYYVSAYSGAPGQAAFAVGDTGQLGTQTTYVTQRETKVKDALSNVTDAAASIECGGYGDSACYVTATTTDAEGHRTIAPAMRWGVRPTARRIQEPVARRTAPMPSPPRPTTSTGIR